MQLERIWLQFDVLSDLLWRIKFWEWPNGNIAIPTPQLMRSSHCAANWAHPQSSCSRKLIPTHQHWLAGENFNRWVIKCCKGSIDMNGFIFYPHWSELLITSPDERLSSVRFLVSCFLPFALSITGWCAWLDIGTQGSQAPDIQEISLLLAA